MANPATNPDTEDERFLKEVEQVKAWWSDSRWRQTKRPFTAEQIVSKRGNLKIEYPSSAQAKKLWDILEHRFAVRHTFLPPTPPVQRPLLILVFPDRGC
jgi:isocitrate lyase